MTYITVKQFADQNDTYVMKVYRMIRNGTIPFKKLGNTYLVKSNKTEKNG